MLDQRGGAFADEGEDLDGAMAQGQRRRAGASQQRVVLSRTPGALAFGNGRGGIRQFPHPFRQARAVDFGAAFPRDAFEIPQEDAPAAVPAGERPAVEPDPAECTSGYVRRQDVFGCIRESEAPLISWLSWGFPARRMNLIF
jgi:hypothetical protein